MARRSAWGRFFVGAALVGLAAPWGLLLAGVPLPPPPPPPPGSRVPAKAPGVPVPVPVVSHGPARITEQSYIGMNRCVGCHRPQADVWSSTKHSHEFAGLPVNYRNDPECLKCHVTAMGNASGFAVGMNAKSAKDLAEIGCEACHGPGALHENAAQRFANAGRGEEDKLEKEMKAAIVKIPPTQVCAGCHSTQGHKGHPYYEGQPPAKAFVPGAVVIGGVPGGMCPTCDWSAAPAGTNIKACAACHYHQYQNWAVGTHANAASVLPAKYAADRDCLKCHATGAVGELAVDAKTAGERLNVGCESCHGPARNHVEFNRQFIAGPRLSPELEQTARQLLRQGQPPNACIECHTVHSHKEHPKFDRPASAART